MKTIRNLFLVFALTATFAFADGHTGNGNRCDTCPPPCTENCGGFAGEEEGQAIVSNELTEAQAEEESYFEYWTEVLFELVS